MRAKVISIQSGSQFTDGQQRLEIKFDDANGPFNHVRFSEAVLGLPGLRLDDELIVDFTPASILAIDAPLAQVIRHEQNEQGRHES